jgi:hypothetical protein
MKVLNIIKEATRDLLNEETFKTIEEGLIAEVKQIVTEKSEAAVKVALESQDAEHAAALSDLMEKVDTDRAGKLQLALEAMETDHIEKLLALKESYESVLSKQAVELRDELRVQISKYLDLQLEKAVPTTQLKEAAKETFARSILGEARKLFSINDIRENEVVMEAVQDGVAKIKNLELQLEKANKQLKTISGRAASAQAELILSEKVSSLPESKAIYLKNFFKGKGAEYINENFEYVVGLYNKEESERRHKISEETKELRRRSNVDRLVVEKRSDDAEFSSPAKVENSGDGVLNYISELKRNDSKRYGNA